jgi:POT family proton-dependent oligopeptide transporter
VIYPLIDRVFPLTLLRKMGIGLVVTGASFVISAWIETQIKAGLTPSIGWQLPAYALLTAGEIMVSISSLEFSYTQAPKSMKSVVMAIYLWSISAGNLFTALVHVFIKNADGTLMLSGASYYLFFAALSAAAGVVFAFVAKLYKEKTYLQDAAFPEELPPSEAAPVA